MSEDHQHSIIKPDLEGLRLRVRKPSRWLKIIHQVTAAVGDNSWDRGVCWGKLGIVSESEERGACNLMDIVGASTSVGDIWLGIGLGGTVHGARSRALGGGKKELTRDQCLLMIFGPILTSIGEFWLWPVTVQNIWLESTSVEDIDDPNEVHGGLWSCGYVGS